MSNREIITRKEAEARGLKSYFTGVPCKHGHIEERLISSGCRECGRIKWKKLYSPEKESERHQRRRAADPEGFSAYIRDYNEKNRDKRNAGARRRHKDDPQKARDKVARALAKNPNVLKERDQRHYAKHAGRRKAAWKQWREDNPEKLKEQNAKWARKNPIKVKAKTHKRLARLAGAGGSYSAAEIENIYRLQTGRCAYCRLELDGKYQVDHIIPICEGGKNIARNI